MNFDLLFFPLAVQVLLTIGLLVWTGYIRVRAVKAAEVKLKDVALNSDAWPGKVRQVGHCYRNQFELPLLYYLICVLAYITVTANYFFLFLAWAFVGTRLVHAWIFTTSNNVRHRFYAFGAGAAVLAVMWLMFAGQIVLGFL